MGPTHRVAVAGGRTQNGGGEHHAGREGRLARRLAPRAPNPPWPETGGADAWAAGPQAKVLGVPFMEAVFGIRRCVRRHARRSLPERLGVLLAQAGVTPPDLTA